MVVCRHNAACYANLVLDLSYQTLAFVCDAYIRWSSLWSSFLASWAWAHDDVVPPGANLASMELVLRLTSINCLRYVLGDRLEEKHQEFVSVVQSRLLDLLVDQPQLLAFYLWAQEDEGFEDGYSVHFMLLYGAVPHHVYLVNANSVVIVKEFKQEVAFLYDLWMQWFAEDHVENLILIHPFDKSFFCQPSWSELI